MSRRRQCTECTKTHATTFVMCPSCRKRIRERSRRVYTETKNDGLCTACRKWEAKGDSVYCDGCVDRYRSYWAATRSAARERGDCGRCAKRPAAPGRSNCQKCINSNNKAQIRKTRRDRGHGLGASKIMHALSHATCPLTLGQLAEASALSTRQVLRHMRRLIPDTVESMEDEQNWGAGATHRKVYVLARKRRINREAHA